MIVVSDTTPLSSLIQLDRLFILKILFNKILIPGEVADELFKKPHLKLIINQNSGWIEICVTRNEQVKNNLLKILDKGESAAIVLALERKAKLILIDERKGKHIASQYQLETTGTIGILIKAKQAGLLKQIKPDLIRLREELNFWISDTLTNEVLALVNE